MSLKVFHLFFITLAVLLCLGFGVWCVQQNAFLAYGVGSFIAAAGLVIYEIIFLKRVK